MTEQQTQDHLGHASPIKQESTAMQRDVVKQENKAIKHDDHAGAVQQIPVPSPLDKLTALELAIDNISSSLSSALSNGLAKNARDIDGVRDTVTGLSSRVDVVESKALTHATDTKSNFSSVADRVAAIEKKHADNIAEQKDKANSLGIDDDKIRRRLKLLEAARASAPTRAVQRKVTPSSDAEPLTKAQVKNMIQPLKDEIKALKENIPTKEDVEAMIDERLEMVQNQINSIFQHTMAPQGLWMGTDGKVYNMRPPYY